MTTNRIVRGLPAEQYHSDTATISKHGLDLINRAPALYQHKLLNPETERAPALRWGSLVHTRVLEPHLWDETTIVAPDIDRRTKVGKEAWESFIALAGGREVISRDEALELEAIAAAVRAHPSAAALLDGDVSVEDSVYWTDEETGIACRARPDLIRCDGIVVDLKTTQDASAGSFARDAAKYRYHVQAAFYLDGLRANGVAVDSFAFVAVEKSSPFLVQCFVADDDFVTAGRAAYRRDLELYKRCLTSGDWPGYAETIQPLSLPAWAGRE